MKETDILVIATWMIFLGLYFLGTQKIYSTKYASLIVLVIIILSIALFFFFDKRYPEQKVHYFLLLPFYYGILLLFIKFGYRKLNRTLAKRRLLSPVFADKDFTFVTLSDYGDTLWARKIASQPSWLDHVLSNSLILGPLLFMLLTPSLA